MANGVSKAEELAEGTQSISIAEFFERNRHLLGFDNKRKGLLTAVKEGVDNALDACEEADVLPEITVEIHEISGDKYRLVLEDNGPGIVKDEIPKIFGKLLYGSKFHQLKMQRGQQGIGISAAVMYAQLTTGKPARITSKIAPDEPAKYFELKIDTETNEPEILTERQRDWPNKDHGTRIELDLVGSYARGRQSIDEYIRETAIINPHASITYLNPRGKQRMLVRGTEEKPPETDAIKPHPYGVEIGAMQKMAERTDASTVNQFLKHDFTRVGRKTAKSILEKAKLKDRKKPKDLTRNDVEALIDAVQETDIMMPPTDCIAPIGAETLEQGLKKEINAEFYTSTTRKPSVYRGNPFLIEAALAWGGELDEDGLCNVLRFANRVPLLYQRGACAATKGIQNTNWRNYNVSQSKGSRPKGPMTILVHIASVWVPFTSEAKEAIAHYPEILKEVKLAVQSLGRDLKSYLNRKNKVKEELKKRRYIKTYIPHIAEALADLNELDDDHKKTLQDRLKTLLERDRGEVEDIDFDPDANDEYDEELAEMGR